MTRQDGPRINEEHLRQGSPVNSLFTATFPRTTTLGNTVIAATGVELAVAIPLQAGDVVTNITFVTATTAAGTPTAGYAALRSPAGALLAQTADFGSTARAANTAFTVALATAQLISTSGLYIVGISFTAGTVPTLSGVTHNNAVVCGALGLSMPVLAQSHGSAVGAVAPATIATPTTVATVPQFFLT